MIDKKQLRQLVEHVLRDLEMPGADNLVLGTIAQESRGGTYIAQLGGGPAKGIGQCEPATEADMWRYLNRPDKANIKARFCVATGVNFASQRQLTANLAYQIALIRLKYWMNPLPIPHANDISGMAKMWKQVYNSHGGKGTEEEFIRNYKEYVE